MKVNRVNFEGRGLNSFLKIVYYSLYSIICMACLTCSFCLFCFFEHVKDRRFMIFIISRGVAKICKFKIACIALIFLYVYVFQTL